MPDDTTPLARLEKVDDLREQADETEAEILARIRDEIETAAGENFDVHVTRDDYGGINVKLRPDSILDAVELPSDEWNVELTSRTEYTIYHEDHEAYVKSHQDTGALQRARIKTLKQLISEIDEEFEDGAPKDEILLRANEVGMGPDKAESEIEKLRHKGEVYEPKEEHFRTT